MKEAAPAPKASRRPGSLRLFLLVSISKQIKLFNAVTSRCIGVSVQMLMNICTHLYISFYHLPPTYAPAYMTAYTHTPVCRSTYIGTCMHACMHARMEAQLMQDRLDSYMRMHKDLLIVQQDTIRKAVLDPRPLILTPQYSNPI